MWTCPKCGREFARTNQGHYCGKAPETVEAYIEAQPEEARAHLTELRRIMRDCAPDAAERIAWSMPVYKQEKRSVSFAACKKHISFYADAAALESCMARFSEFVIRKNAIYLPYDRPLPVCALEDLVRESFPESGE